MPRLLIPNRIYFFSLTTVLILPFSKKEMKTTATQATTETLEQVLFLLAT